MQTINGLGSTTGGSLLDVTLQFSLMFCTLRGFDCAGI